MTKNNEIEVLFSDGLFASYKKVPTALQALTEAKV